MFARSLAAVALLLTAASSPWAALADAQSAPPPTIAISANASVDFIPDIAKLTLGVRVEAPAAQQATNSVNQRAGRVIAALHALGISANAIKTSSYNLEYREPQTPQPASDVQPSQPQNVVPMNASASASAPMPRPPEQRLAAGSYVATETLEVTSPVGLAGRALDAAINAGANQSFGLSYQSSNEQSLYRAALAKAVLVARQSADAMAHAAHLTIVGVQSISNSSQVSEGMAVGYSARSMSAAQVLPGTEAIGASVFIVYRIR